MKRVTDEVRKQIRRDREQEGMTLYQLVDKYGRSKSTIAGIIKGCDTSNVKRAAPGRKVVSATEPMERPNLSKVDLGEAARQMICARLMFAGVKVFMPMTEDTPIDLLVLKGDGFLAKVQCKYIYPTQNGSHRMQLCSSRSNGSGAQRHSYTKEEVDFFVGYCQDNDSVYVIPFDAVSSRIEVSLWILRKRAGNNGAVGIDEFEWRNRFDLLV